MLNNICFLILVALIFTLSGCDFDSLSNSAPITITESGRTVNSGETVSLAGQASDSDGSIATHEWIQTTGPSVSITNAQRTQASFIAPDVEGTTEITFKFLAIDNEGKSHSSLVTFSVIGQNVAPVTSVIAESVAKAGEQVLLLAQALDTDGSIASYSWQQTSGEKIELSDPTALSTMFTAPSLAEENLLSFSFTATDEDNASHTSTVSLVVLAVNLPPVTSVVPVDKVIAGQSVVLSGEAFDENGTVNHYIWKQRSGPLVSIEGAETANATFVAPILAEASVLVFEFEATDEQGASNSSMLVINVEKQNIAPVTSVEPGRIVQASEVVTLFGSATDEDGEIVSYSWEQRRGIEVDIIGRTLATASFVAPAANEVSLVEFEFTATDSGGLSHSSIVSFDVEAKTSILATPVNYLGINSGICLRKDIESECIQVIEKIAENTNENAEGQTQYLFDKPEQEGSYALTALNTSDYPIISTLDIDASNGDELAVNMTLLTSLLSAYHQGAKDNLPSVALATSVDDFAEGLGVETEALLALPGNHLTSAQYELIAFSAISTIDALTHHNISDDESWFNVYELISQSLVENSQDLSNLPSNDNEFIVAIDEMQLEFANQLFNAIAADIYEIDTADDFTYYVETIAHFIDRWENEAMIEPSLYTQNIIEAYNACVAIRCVPVAFTTEFSLTTDNTGSKQSLNWTSGVVDSTNYRVSIYQGSGESKVLSQVVDIRNPTIDLPVSNVDMSYTVAEIVYGVVQSPSNVFVVTASDDVVDFESCSI